MSVQLHILTTPIIGITIEHFDAVKTCLVFTNNGGYLNLRYCILALAINTIYVILC